MPHEGRTCHAPHGQAHAQGGHVSTADVARVSLLTVRVILAQVKLSFSGLPPGNTTISTTYLPPAT
jgi:hypothetical protein